MQIAKNGSGLLIASEETKNYLMLALPVTIRIPNEDELDHRPDIEEILHKRRRANIREGYTLTLNDNARLPFRFQAAINIDNDRLWDLFLALAATLPDKVSCVYGLYEAESGTTDVLQKGFILQELGKYQQELTQECALEFGLLFRVKDFMIELTVTESKYIRYWGIALEQFRMIMQSFKLEEVKGLEFVDEYPKIVTPLRELTQGAKAPETVLYYLDRAFGLNREQREVEFD